MLQKHLFADRRAAPSQYRHYSAQRPHIRRRRASRPAVSAVELELPNGAIVRSTRHDSSWWGLAAYTAKHVGPVVVTVFLRDVIWKAFRLIWDRARARWSTAAVRA